MVGRRLHAPDEIAVEERVMFWKHTPRRRSHTRNPRGPRRRYAVLEPLEGRRLLTGSVPSGTYVEDFALNSDLTQPGFDVGAAFSERFDSAYYVGTALHFVSQQITDP